MKKYIIIISSTLLVGLFLSFYFLISKITKLKYGNSILNESNKKLEKALTETIELNKQVNQLNEDSKNKVSKIKVDKNFEQSLEINDDISKKFNLKSI